MKILTKRFWRYLYQRWTRGWDDSDLWSLDYTIAKFVLPRLKRFKNYTHSFPPNFTMQTWEEAIDDMIYAMEISSDFDKKYDKNTDWDRVSIGLSLFGEYFMDLWD